MSNTQATEAAFELAISLDDHQSSRGDEFRDASNSDRLRMARPLVRARSMVDNSGPESFEDVNYTKALVYHKMLYFYYASAAGVDFDEAKYIWWSVVHGDPSPHERRSLV